MTKLPLSAFTTAIHGIPPEVARQWLCLFAVFVVMYLAALDQTIVITVMAKIQQRFHTKTGIGWIISGYMLPVAVLTLVWGRLAYLFGTKSVICIAVVVFEIGSLVSALSISMNMLIVGRVIAGIGGGGIQTVVYLILNDISTLQNRGMFLNVVNIAYAVSSVSGPLLGGAFGNSSRLTWRWCFYVNLPIGAFALICLLLSYRPISATKKIPSILNMARSVDLIGLILLSCGLTFLLLGLSFVCNYRGDSFAVAGCFVLGGVFTVLFLVYDLFLYNPTGDQQPLLALQLLRLTPVYTAALTMFFGEMVFIITCIAVANDLQYVLDLSAWKTGVYLLPMVMSVVVFSTMTAILMSKTRYVKPFALTGALFSCLGAGLLVHAIAASSKPKLLGLQVFVGIGFGLIIQPGMTSPQIPVKEGHPQLLNMVTTFLAFCRALGAAMGAAFETIIFTATVLKDVKIAKLTGISEDLNDLLAAVSSDSSSFSEDGKRVIKSSIADGYRLVMVIAAVFGGVEVISSIFMDGHRVPLDAESESQTRLEISVEESEAS